MNILKLFVAATVITSVTINVSAIKKIPTLKAARTLIGKQGMLDGKKINDLEIAKERVIFRSYGANPYESGGHSELRLKQPLCLNTQLEILTITGPSLSTLILRDSAISIDDLEQILDLEHGIANRTFMIILEHCPNITLEDAYKLQKKMSQKSYISLNHRHINFGLPANNLDDTKAGDFMLELFERTTLLCNDKNLEGKTREEFEVALKACINTYCTDSALATLKANPTAHYQVPMDSVRSAIFSYHVERIVKQWEKAQETPAQQDTVTRKRARE